MSAVEVGEAAGAPYRVVGISGSPSPRSKSRLLLQYALERLAGTGAATETVDLSVLPADGLLGRAQTAEVAAALEAVGAARIVVVSTPVYRATYSGLLKVFFDLLAPQSLAGKIGIPIATGGVAGHQLALDHGLRPLFASVGAVVVPTGTFGTDAHFPGGVPDLRLRERIDRAVAEALALAGVERLVSALPHSQREV